MTEREGGGARQRILKIINDWERWARSELFVETVHPKARERLATMIEAEFGKWEPDAAQKKKVKAK